RSVRGRIYSGRETLGDDPPKAKLADRLKHLGAVTLGMLQRTEAPPSVGRLVPACPRRRAETVSLLRGQVLAKSQPQRPQPCAWQTLLLHKDLRVSTKL